MSPWVITAVGLALGAICYVVYALLGLVRQNASDLRQRVQWLEVERDGLIQQVAALKGVPAAPGDPAKPYRTAWTDPQTGYVHFSDGEVRDGLGKPVLGREEPAEAPKAGEDVPERLRDRLDRWRSRYPRQDTEAS